LPSESCPHLVVRIKPPGAHFAAEFREHALTVLGGGLVRLRNVCSAAAIAFWRSCSCTRAAARGLLQSTCSPAVGLRQNVLTGSLGPGEFVWICRRSPAVGNALRVLPKPGECACMRKIKQARNMQKLNDLRINAEHRRQCPRSLGTRMARSVPDIPPKIN